MLYLRSSRVTLQLLRIWHSVYRSPHNLHTADKCSFFLLRARLALWGRVPLEAFSANFIYADGRDWHAFAQIVAALVSTSLKSLPWVGSERLCSNRLLFTLLTTTRLALLDTTLHGAPGSEAKASCATV